MIRFVPAQPGNVSTDFAQERRPWPPTGPEIAQAQIAALTARIAALEARIAGIETPRRTDDPARLIRRMLDEAERRHTPR